MYSEQDKPEPYYKRPSLIADLALIILFVLIMAFMFYIALKILLIMGGLE